jgi:hypothetical protein
LAAATRRKLPHSGQIMRIEWRRLGPRERRHNQSRYNDNGADQEIFHFHGDYHMFKL